MENEKKKHNFNIWALFSAIFAVGALICIIILIKTTVDQKKRAEEMAELVKGNGEVETSVEVASSDPDEKNKEHSGDEPSDDPAGATQETESTEETPKDPFAASVQAIIDLGIPIPDLEVDIAGMQESTNKDIYAWIYIPGTKVNYPVLQHPTDDVYYLNYNIDGTKGYPGCVYSEVSYNSKDFNDSNTVLYAHNMKNGTMFGSLHKYEDRDFFDKNRYIYVYTQERLLCYRIIAAYEHSNEHLLYYHNFSDSETMQWYFDKVKAEKVLTNNFDEEYEITGNEHLITLSTCINGKSDKRFLVQGVLLNEE